MPRGVLLVRTAPADGRESEYNDWYDDTHLGDILKVAGFTSARRFRTVTGDDLPYLALYEVEADDLKAAQALLRGAVASGEVRMSGADVIARDPTPSMAMYEQITEKQG